ncbi:class I SAM-dependent DNA methyltransferase [Minwuia sp.]|uniref:class I SAM-dependent DNA methyltransferase n=1 Tax=Minwuia sp. TaxID=2493630 RepID=UPI003A950678
MPDGDEFLRKVYASGGDVSSLSESYNSWSESYDADLSAMGYRYPFMVAGTLGRFVPDLGSRILDAGCGSGMIGQALSLVGYRNIVGIDISDGMLRMAATKACYIELRKEQLGERLGFSDAEFDTIVSSGVMTVGHAPPECLHELARVVKSGGHFVVTIVREAWEDGYRDMAQRMSAGRVLSPLFSTDYFTVLPGAGPDEQTEARVHVFRKL